MWDIMDTKKGKLIVSRGLEARVMTHDLAISQIESSYNCA